MKALSLTPFVVSLFLIIILGLTTILSIYPDLFQNQLIFFLSGLFLLILTSRVNSKTIEQVSPLLYLFAIATLVLTLILGNATRGSVRWIDLGIFRLQPSELAKPLLIAFFAHRFTLPIRKPLPWLIKNAILFALPAGLVFIQPDLGSTLVLCAIWGGMLITSKFPKKTLILLGAVGILMLPLGYNFLHDYQKQRIHTFINPFSDPSGSGYNVIQAMIAVGSGNILGKGVRQGTQSHLRFLPERHTDFAFASFSEEFGFIGVTLLLSGFFVFLYWLTSLMDKLEDFDRLVVAGTFWMFLFQTVVNVGMNMGVLPVTGITLPFISYGGSSILSSAITLGFVLSTRRSRKRGE